MCSVFEGERFAGCQEIRSNVRLMPKSGSPRWQNDRTVDSLVTPTADDIEERDLPPHPPHDTPGGIDLEFRPDIEGLRAVAVILVVLYHCRIKWLHGGFEGVDVFFVLSGFLITGLLLKEHDSKKRISILGFYARRTRRILPAAMFVLIVTVLLSYYMLTFNIYGNVAQDGRWSSVFLANIHFSTFGAQYFNLGAPPSPLTHYWSLAVEEQFYLVWPVLLLIVGWVCRALKVPIRWIVLGMATTGFAASLWWSIVQTSHNPNAAFFSPFTRAWELAAGAALAACVPWLQKFNWEAGVALAWTGLVVIVGGAFMLPDDQYHGAMLLYPVVGAMAVVAGGASGVGAGHLLGFRPVRSIGRVSYGWYLLHFPLMILAVGPIWNNVGLPIHENLLIAVGSLAAAYVMFYCLEKPIRRSRFLARHPWISILVGAIFVMAAWTLCYVLTPSIHHIWFT
jgi:peptidoglycan/LPS O-acetylase OafA/YrhL